MKNLVVLVFLFLLLCPSSVFSATSQEEGRLVQSVKRAFAAQDVKLLLDIYCWDGVTEEVKQFAVLDAKDMVRQRPLQIVIVPPDKNDKGSFTHKGIRYSSNLKIIKQLKISLRENKFTGETYIPLGGKNGRLYFTLPRPAK